MAGKCVADPRDSSTAGTGLVLWGCNRGDAQWWWHYRDGLVPNPGNLMCIDAPSGSSGTRLKVADCGSPSDPSQPRGKLWREPATQIALTGTGKCLGDGNDMYGNPVLGARAAIWPCYGFAPQDWSLYPMGGTPGAARYTIGMFDVSYCLNVSGAGTADGTAVTVAGCSYGAGQIWELGPRGELINPHSGKCLNDPGGNTASGTKLTIWSCNGWARQRWTPPPVPVSADLPGMCLDDRNGGTANGTAVQAGRCNGKIAQRWTLAPDGTLRAFGRCLNAYGSGTANGTPVDLWACNGSAGQQWRLGQNGWIINPQSSRCLDIPGISPAAGTQLVIWDCPTALGAGWHMQ